MTLVNQELNIVSKNKILPEFFKPLLWSYNFSKIDPQKDKKIIIINAINYGDLKHWQWLIRFYGWDEVRKFLSEVVATELRPRVRRLAALIFDIKKFNYAPRGSR